MRITFISPALNMGGGSRVISIYANALVRMGHSVTIVSSPPDRISLMRRVKSWLKGEGWPPSPSPASYRIDGAVEQRVLDQYRPVTDNDVPDGDIVLATWWETAEWVNALRPSKGVKAYFIQGHEIFPYLPIVRCKATYRMPLHKIVVAQWLKHVMSSEYGDDVVDVVPNSVDREQFFAPVRDKQLRPTVGLLFSTAPLKGLDTALASLRVVRQQVPNLRVICFGSERPRSALLSANKIEFYFLPAQNKLRELYAQCDVWLSASRSEGFNLPALEAMACRTPVVATKTGWPEEVIKSGVNGILSDIDDTNSLARGIEWVLSLSNEEWRNLSANAYATAASSSWEESTDMLEKALLRVYEKFAQGEVRK